MRELLNETISATYHYGSRVRLTPAWNDKNVICPNSKLYYVIDGELSVSTERQILVARQGEAILIPAGMKHSYQLTELGYAEKYWFHFDLRLGTSNYFEQIRFPYLVHLGMSQELTEAFDAVVNTAVDKPSEKLRAASAILSILSLYMKDAEYVEQLRENDMTDRVIAFMKKNYPERLTLEQLSEMARLSPNYFEKKFKERVGHPPLKYINMLRLERAKFLLEYTELSIGEVMEKVGFWDPAHFSKLFKSETGYSPSKYRMATSGRSIK